MLNFYVLLVQPNDVQDGPRNGPISTSHYGTAASREDGVTASALESE